MTTYYSVQPSQTGAPQFTATLDGLQYTIQVKWVLFGQRYYVFCYNSSGVQVFSRPLIESLPGIQIDAISYDELSGLAIVATDQPHGFKIGSTTNLTIAGASPDTYNGTYWMLATGANTLSFPLSVSSNPGQTTVAGTLSFIISMTAAYFNSTMIYRNGQFEVSP
jgi:hypothetical protein